MSIHTILVYSVLLCVKCEYTLYFWGVKCQYTLYLLILYSCV